MGRAIDEVTVKFSAQEGTEKTEVIEKRVPGDYEFVVGAEERAGNTRLFITKIKIRDGNFRSRKGDAVLAKYVKRIFARKKGIVLVNAVSEKDLGEDKRKREKKKNVRSSASSL